MTEAAFWTKAQSLVLLTMGPQVHQIRNLLFFP